jgi:phospholipase C
MERKQPHISRRELLTLAAGTAALGLGAAPRPSFSGAGVQTAAVLPDPAKAPFDTVVVLMMENRSFDHVLGWLPGANGQPAGLKYADIEGVEHETWSLARDPKHDFYGCDFGDPVHDWQGIAKHYNGGRCDGFLKTANAGDRFPIGYYREGDLPILSALAKGYTAFDNYFCSMQGPTWENRLYQLTGTTQLGPKARSVVIETAIFDRLRAKGLTAAYYHHKSPVTELFASAKYDDITYPIAKFWTDARDGRLANVVFVDPDFSDKSEDAGTSNDYHPWGNVLVAEGFVAAVHDALKQCPQWKSMVFVLNFDEHGGFFDHVPPPACEDDTILPLDEDGRRPDLKRLGFRVPAIAMGPFAPQRIEKAGPYEHCSILKMIEWRWGLDAMTQRDGSARNFAEALDFTIRRAPIVLPRFAAPPPTGCSERWTDQVMPVSRKGWVRRVVELPAGSRIRCARIVKVDDTGKRPGQPYSKLARKRVDGKGKVALRMKLTEEARRDVAEEARRAVAESDTDCVAGPNCSMPGKVFAQLETTIVERDGTERKEVEWAILVPRGRDLLGTAALEKRAEIGAPAPMSED